MIPTPRFPPLGPLRRCVPQVPRYYQDAVTPWCPSRSASFPSRSRYHGSARPSVRSRRRRARFLRRTWSLFTRLLRPGIMHVETPGPPKFPWSLLCPFAHVHATPAGRVSQTTHKTPVLPPRVQLRRLRRPYFRGSVAWLPNSLSTLRSAGYPVTTQDSLPAAGQALPDGTRTRKGSDERFPSQLLIDFPPSRAS